MPYCPKCRDEFQDWVKTCPDCGVALVDKLPPQPTQHKRKKQDEPLVYVATAPREEVANMWSGILEEHGIRCLLKGGELRAALYVSPYNPYEIHVLASKAKRAAQILAPFLEDQLS